MNGRLDAFLSESQRVEEEEQSVADEERALRMRIEGLLSQGTRISALLRRTTFAEGALAGPDEKEARALPPRVPRLPDLPELEESLTLRRFMVARRRAALLSMSMRLDDHRDVLLSLQQKGREHQSRLVALASRDAAPPAELMSAP